MRQEEFEQKVCAWIQQEKMLKEGDVILLGISGGADSVALLRFFCQVRQRFLWEIHVIHVEHGLRGQDSIEDARFVEDLCQELQVPFFQVSLGDEIARMEDTHKSLEERARELRYQAFFARAEQLEEKTKKPVRIAVAHHQEDNVETLLFHLVRGTGLDGMRGMPGQRGAIVRPFMAVRRKEILSYLEEKKQSYRQDLTNFDTLYRRNKIRQEVLPLLCDINAQAIPHMQQAALLMGQVADYINDQAAKVLQEAKRSQEGWETAIAVQEIQRLPDFLQREVLHLWVQSVLPGAKDIGANHIGMLQLLLTAQVGKSCDLPGGWQAKRSYQTILLKKGKQQQKLQPVQWIEKEALQQGPVTLFWKNLQLMFSLKDREEGMEIPKNRYTKCFDYDKIRDNMQLRTRQPGDYFFLSSEGQKKKVKTYFIDEKIPQEKRGEIPLLCEGEHVLWVIGYRISEHYKINKNTKRILEVQVIEEKENE